jgi:hypothetical protein
MTADQFYYKKFLEWQQKGNGDYRVYIRSAGRPKIKADLLSNKEEFEREVCSYLKAYAKGQERQSILSLIQGIANPDRDILEIIVGATLDACGYSDMGNVLVGLAIVGIIGAALIALLGNRK